MLLLLDTTPTVHNPGRSGGCGATSTARGQRRGRETVFRRYLFDVKTIHTGTFHYSSAHTAKEQSDAVRHREAHVRPVYEAHARALDAHCYGGTGTHPFLDRLRLFTTTRIWGGIGGRPRPHLGCSLVAG